MIRSPPRTGRGMAWWWAPAAAAAFCLSGCASLGAWQRAVLESRVMDPVGSPLEAALDDHVFAIREAAQGATGAAGSSCGCN